MINMLLTFGLTAVGAVNASLAVLWQLAQVWQAGQVIAPALFFIRPFFGTVSFILLDLINFYCFVIFVWAISIGFPFKVGGTK